MRRTQPRTAVDIVFNQSVLYDELHCELGLIDATLEAIREKTAAEVAAAAASSQGAAGAGGGPLEAYRLRQEVIQQCAPLGLGKSTAFAAARAAGF